MLQSMARSCLGLALLGLALFAGGAAARGVDHAEGQLIVKFKSEGSYALGECAQSLLASGRSFRDATADGSDSLDGLRRRLGVRRARALFRRADGRAFGEQRRQLRQRLERARARHGLRTRRGRPSATAPDLSHIYLVELSGEMEVGRAVSLLRKDPHVEYAQPNFILESDFTPDDPHFASSGSWGQDFEDLWGLHHIRAEGAWDLSQGEGIVVAVVDSGLDYDHPDIADNAWINPGEDLNGNGIVDESDYNGVDDEGNGYVDDLRGFDFHDSVDADENGDFDGPEDVSDGDPFDDRGHGTHVAGTIAAVGDNGRGIIGVAPRARIMPIRVFGSSGGATATMLAQAMVYAVENHADVINNSWSCGGRCPENPVIEEVVELAYQQGLVIVTSAGNAADDILFYSPEKLRQTIAVGASNRNGERASFSSFGLLMDVLAPGGGPNVGPPSYAPKRNILSLRSSEVSSNLDSSGALRVGDDYLRLSGTSMSAPHVAGLAALILARHPEFSNDDVRTVLRLTAEDLGAPGRDRHTGSGRVDAAGAVALDSLPRVRVEIASPRQGSTARQQSGLLEIEGTVSGPDLLEYSLFFGRGFEPDEWTPIAADRAGPVTDGVIARWPIGELEDGLHVVKLVATTYDGSRFEEFLFLNLERNTPISVSPPGEKALLPVISGDFVVWQAEPPPSDETSDETEVQSLWLTDLRDGSEYEIATGLTGWLRASISGTDIAWQRADENSIHTCRFDPDSGACSERRVAVGSDWASLPDVSDGRIVWSEYRDDEMHLLLCEIDESTGACPEQEIPLDAEGISGAPEIDGLRLLWRSQWLSSGGLRTCEWSPATRECPVRRVFDDDVPRFDFALGGHLIAWEEDDPWIAPFRMCEVDSVTGECPVVTIGYTPVDSDYVAVEPAISGRRVVWNARGDDGNLDIYFCEYDRVTRSCPPQRLTGHATRQSSPAIDGDWIVFEDERQGGSEIAAFELPSLDPIGPRVVAEGDRLRIRVKARDPTGDPLGLDARLAGGEALETIGAHFQELGRGRAELRWSPGTDQAGSYAITFTATTSGRLRTGETIRIEVLDVNTPPVAIVGRSRIAVARTRLNGCRSFDPEDQPLAYTWRDGSGRELGASCRLRVEGPSLPKLESYTLTVSDGTYSDSGRVWVLWMPRYGLRDSPRWWWPRWRR